MKKIGFIYTGGRKEKLAEVIKKEAPADFYYGALEMEKRNYEVELIQDAEIPQPWYSRLFNFISVYSYRFLGIHLNMTVRMSVKKFRQRINNLDYIVATSNLHGSTLAFLKLLGLIKTNIIFLAMAYITPGNKNLGKLLRRAILKKSVIGLENYSEINLLQNIFQNEKKLFYIPFGVDEKFWYLLPLNQDNKNEKYVLSIGNDRMRDFASLIKAWKPEYPLLKIVTKLALPSALPKNICQIKTEWKKPALTDKEIRTLYQKSEFVIISLKKNTFRSSGESVCLQAMACGKAIIMSETQGLWDKNVIKHKKNILLSCPESLTDLQKNVELLLTNQDLREKLGREARSTLENNYTITHLANRLEQAINYP